MATKSRRKEEIANSEGATGGTKRKANRSQAQDETSHSGKARAQKDQRDAFGQVLGNQVAC